MRVLAIVHQPDTGPGVFADAMQVRGIELEAWHPPNEPSPPHDIGYYDAAMTFGGAMHPDSDREHPWLTRERGLLAELLGARVPLLGVCLGSQLLAQAAGGQAVRRAEPEIGWYDVRRTDEGAGDPLLAPLGASFRALEWHSYHTPLPSGAVALAHSDACLQAYRIGDCAWGIQFHAEVVAGDVEAWIDDYRSDQDAVRIELDAEGLREQTRSRIRGWNELGRGLCERFLDAALVWGGVPIRA